MTPGALLILAMLFGDNRRSKPSTPPKRRPPARLPGRTVPASNKPTERPQRPAEPPPPYMPKGVPAFPGPEWVTVKPVTPAIAKSASHVLSALWKIGPNTVKFLQTEGEWIAYVSTPMGDKRGVVAYRLKGAQPSTPAKSDPKSPAPAKDVIVRPPGKERPPVIKALESKPSPVALPMLRKGSRGKEVKLLQQKLGGLQVDGIFGKNTELAVIAYQAKHRLKVDGIVGPQTWGSLFGRKA